jgi:undecaprenyl-diphosphatase
VVTASAVERVGGEVVAGQGPDDDLMSGDPWRRHPVDVARLVLSLVALAATFGLAVRHPAEVRSVAVDLVDAVNSTSSWVRDLLLGSTQLLAIAVPVAMVAVLARTPRLLVTAMGAAMVAAAAMAALQGRVDQAVPNRVQLVSQRPSWVLGAAFPSGAYIAAFSAVIVVLGPVLSRGWRRAAVVGLLLGMLSRVLTAVAVPLNLAITGSVGAFVGSAALAAFGSPRRTASRRIVLEALGRAGFPAVAIDPFDIGSHRSQAFVARTASGRRAFVKLVGRDERSADLLYRLVRLLRVKDLDDERPSWTPAEMVRHEALMGLLATTAGARTAGVVAVGETEGGDGLLAVEVVDGRSLAALDPEDVTDELLDLAWRELLAVHAQGIAHRWLTADHLLVTGEQGGPPALTVVDFRWAVPQATDEQLAADVAMLAVSLSATIGAERSVASAARVLPPDQLARALPLVQPLALPEDVRRAVAPDKALLPLVRSGLQEAAGGVEYRLADIERIGPRQLAALVGGAFVVYSLLSFASNWADISRALGRVSPADVPGLAALALVPYATGAMALLSVVPRRLPFWEGVQVMLGQSFLNRFTPANAGGMALRVRYLQKRGVDLGGAAAGVALSSVASGVCQALVLVTFAAWAGSGSGVQFSWPRVSTIALAGTVVLAAAGVVWLTPWGRRVIGRRIETTGRQVWRTLGRLVREPARFVALFGSTLVGKVTAIAAFALSCDATGAHLSLPRLGLLYLTASSVGAAAPTPGGVGGVEAALTAALTGAGVPAAEALSAVFLFRLATYWAPVPLGWFSFHRLQRTILA